MSYGNYTKYNINIWVVLMFRFVFRTFRINPFPLRYFCVLGVFCTINYYFGYGIRILCIFLYIGTDFKDTFQHSTNNKSKHIPDMWTIFVRTIFLRCFWILVLNGLLTIPVPASANHEGFRTISLPGSCNHRGFHIISLPAHGKFTQTSAPILEKDPKSAKTASEHQPV